jgi:hypothetical protein
MLEKAAQTGDTPPSGGSFLAFPSLSAIRDSGEVIFTAVVDGGPNGIFSYDAAADTLAARLTTNDTDDGGNPFCEFQQVGLSDGVAAFTANVGIPDCSSPVQGAFWLVTTGVSVTIARAGDASSIAGTTFEAFLNAPETSSTAITFAAHVSGATYEGDALFTWDGMTIDTIAAVGDPAPGTGGVLKKLGGQHRQTLADDVLARFYTRRTSAGHGIFLYDGSPEAVLLKTDAPPAPPFGANAVFREVEAPGVADDGSFIGMLARVRDSFKPPSKHAILRCTP